MTLLRHLSVQKNLFVWHLIFIFPSPHPLLDLIKNVKMRQTNNWIFLLYLKKIVSILVNQDHFSLLVWLIFFGGVVGLKHCIYQTMVIKIILINPPFSFVYSKILFFNMYLALHECKTIHFIYRRFSSRSRVYGSLVIPK